MQKGRAQSLFLLVTALGLTPIALSYGLSPGRSLGWLFGIDASAVNIRHVFRAVMGLYLALACFWAAGAFMPGLRIPALWSLVVFMVGLALGRILSILVDGWPHPQHSGGRLAAPASGGLYGDRTDFCRGRLAAAHQGGG
nr:DUF4345 domain-containing protein [Aestuariivirga sp.]